MATPKWNSVVLFFNLPQSIRPLGYSNTSKQDVLNFLDLGNDPAPIKISDFMCNYWHTISYGNLTFGIDTPKVLSGNPIIPTITPKDNNPDNWKDLIHKYLEIKAGKVWIAAGKKMKNGLRWIPSIVLVQNYNTGASAETKGFDKEVNNKTYSIGDIFHIQYDLTKTSPTDFPELSGHGRRIWATFAHEYGHNFLGAGDLYGPHGSTGYWDLMGDNTPPGRMSEINSVFKERVGWLQFNQVIEGPQFPKVDIGLRPYTTSGDTIKVIPDPENNPHEFFVLEYRKSTGKELWRPDGGLTEEGLLITHFNTRLGLSKVWLRREAPYFDPEFADFSDSGAALWTGHDRLEGILYPHGSNNSFTKTSKPNSNFYGRRASGLSINKIRVSDGLCRFSLKIKLKSYVGWYVSSTDKAVAGRFHGKNKPYTIFIRNDDKACMLRMIESQWFAVQSAGKWIGDWELTKKDKEPLVGDFDGDGKDELYFRDSKRAGIIKFKNGIWKSVDVQSERIDGWDLGRDNWETIANVDGDSKDEIVIRYPKWIGLLKLEKIGSTQRLKVKHKMHNKVGSWTLNANDGIYGGNFRDKQKQDILITAKNDIGLISYNSSNNKFELEKKQHDRIDSWNIGENDKYIIGDFDSDEYDEIYIRSNKWAGILKWEIDKFKLIWFKKNWLNNISGQDEDKLKIKASDISYTGKFLPDRDCILHRSNKGIYILAWDGSGVKVRQDLISPFNNLWHLNQKDNFVLGDYHTKSSDVGDPNKDFIGDEITDMFIHNDWGTGMVGVNYTEFNPIEKPNQIKEEMGLTWIQEGKILRAITGK